MAGGVLGAEEVPELGDRRLHRFERGGPVGSDQVDELSGGVHAHDSALRRARSGVLNSCTGWPSLWIKLGVESGGSACWIGHAEAPKIGEIFCRKLLRVALTAG